MMAANAGFCPKCGTQLTVGSSFCPKCGNAVASMAQNSGAGRREKQEKREKNEKGEKREKHEKGTDASLLYAFVGGSVLIWLGATFYLEQAGFLPADIWGDYFLAGVGVILILDGLALYLRSRVGLAPLVGGICALLLGVGTIVAHQFRYPQEVWPLVIAALGVCVIVFGVAARRRAPRP